MVKKFDTLLLDKELIQKYKLITILNLFQIQKILHDFCIILCISNKTMHILNKLNPIDKIIYINSTKFNTQILYKSLFICTDHICEIWDIEYNIYSKYILNNLSKFILNKHMHFWISIDINKSNEINNIIKYCGFHSPYICKKSPLKFELKSNSLCLYKTNCIVPYKLTMNNIYYILQQHNIRNNYCSMTAKFTENAIIDLKQIPYKHSNEMSGTLTIIDNKKEGDDIIFYVDIINSSKNEGDKENIIIVNNRYTFHSHPIDAYLRHNVNYAWPSAQDYIGFLQAVVEVKCIFHVITTKEGIYIISISKNYVDKYRKYYKDTSYIRKNFNIKQDVFKSPIDYVEYINKLSIFYLQFLSWNKINSKFIVYFPIDETSIKNCII